MKKLYNLIGFMYKRQIKDKGDCVSGAETRT